MAKDRQVLSAIESLLRQNPKGLTTSAITRHLNGNRNSTAKYLEVLLSSGVAERKQVGASKVYTLAKRVSLRSLMNYTSEGILVLDSRSRIITVNDSLLRFFGLSREALEGKYPDEIPVDLARVFHNSDIICNPAREVVTEISAEIAGTVCHFRVRCLPVRFDDNGNGYTLLIEDITARKRTEDVLRESEERFKTLFEKSAEPQMLLDHAAKVTDCNAALLSLFGFGDKEEILGHVPHEFAPEFQPDGVRSSDRNREILDTVMREGKAQYEWTHQKHDDPRTPILTEAILTRISVAGQPVIHAGIRDISDRKMYQQQLVRSEAQYRAMIETQTDLICRRRPDSTIIFVNSEYLRFFSKTPGEVTGSTFCPADLLVRSAWDSSDAALRILPFYRDTYEQVVLLDGGHIRWLQWKNAVLTDASGTVTEIQSVGRDITVQRQREREILLKRCSIESSDHAMVIFDLVGRIVYANRAFLAMFRCRDDLDVIGRPFDQFVPQEGPDNNVNQLVRILVQHGQVDSYVRGRRMDNTEVELEFHGTLIQNDLNFPLHSIVLVIDRTGTFPPGSLPGPGAPQMVSPVPEGVLLLDPSGRVLSVNRDFLTLAGQGAEDQVIGRPVSRFIGRDPDSPELPFGTAGDPADRNRASGAGWVRQRDGLCVPVSINLRHVRDIAGIHFCTEVAVRPAGSESTLNAHRLTDLLPVPLFIIDRNRQVVFWNHAMEAFTGVRKEEVIGTPGYRQAFYPFFGVEPPLVDLVELPLETIHQIYPGARKYGDTIILERYIPDSRKGEGRYLYDKATILYDPAGTKIGYMGGATDITDWKLSQEFMNRMKDGIEASLSPRILNLTGMIGNVVALRDEGRAPRSSRISLLKEPTAEQY